MIQYPRIMRSLFSMHQRPWYQWLRLSTQVAFAVVSALTLIVFAVEFLWVMLALAVISGPWYCGWLCPFGAAQEWIGKLGSRLIRRRLVVPRGIHRWLIPLRFALLGLSLAGVGALLFLSDPYMNFVSLLGWRVSYVGLGAWAFFAVLLSASLFIDRPFCRFLCVEGAQHGVAGLLRILTIRRDTPNCIGCRRCEAACPTQVPVAEHSHVRHPQCINCLECVSACPTKGGLKLGVF
jgi:polyferredoxin